MVNFVKNIYYKECLRCGQIYLETNPELYRNCANCEKDVSSEIFMKYCDRCGDKVYILDYIKNGGFCNVCASI